MAIEVHLEDVRTCAFVLGVATTCSVAPGQHAAAPALQQSVLPTIDALCLGAAALSRSATALRRTSPGESATWLADKLTELQSALGAGADSAPYLRRSVFQALLKRSPRPSVRARCRASKVRPTSAVNLEALAKAERTNIAFEQHPAGLSRTSPAMPISTRKNPLLASVVMGLSPLLGGKEHTVLNKLLPLFLTQRMPGGVRLNIISNLEAVNSVIGIKQLSMSLLPAIVELAEDSKWRGPPGPSSSTCPFSLARSSFDEKLNQLCMGWLVDHVFAIREAAVLNLRKLHSALIGLLSTVIPKVAELAVDTNYLHRMVCLFCVTELNSACPPDIGSGSSAANCAENGLRHCAQCPVQGGPDSATTGCQL
uniref:DUF3535 domain-containing protein n=1 Tax=Macrostomum lignano TaxID=282301 RepID=A0A1I8FEH0_9PLAT